MNPDATNEIRNTPGRFVTTRWSLILAAGADSPTQGQTALAHLCRAYWRPVFAFVCRRGFSVPDAQDLTQDFFVLLLDGDLLRRADPGRGRFRSFLLKALQNFLNDAHDRRRARKRGGDLRFVSWDEWSAEAPSHLQLTAAADEWPAERLFDARWAATVVERALRTLREECEGRGRGRVYDLLCAYLVTERDEVSYQELARQLSLNPPAVKRLLHQMRQRYRELLRAEVSETVESVNEVDDELRYLCSVLSAGEQQMACA